MAVSPTTPDIAVAGGSIKRPNYGTDGVEYGAWLNEKHGVKDPLTAHRRHYEAVSSNLVETFKSCEFWKSAPQQIKSIDIQYIMKNKYPLATAHSLIIQAKAWESFFQKTYRKNVLNNSNWPDAPAEGWCLPDNWFESIHDIARTSVVVRYLDGVPIVMSSLESMAKAYNMTYSPEFISTNDGYYAAHLNLRMMCEISTMDWKPRDINASLEIQVTTQIKDVIKTLLHTFYENKREYSQSTPDNLDISWNYRSDEFIARYLGHILHYVEGMIIDVRDRKER
jgi:ppGpp synthetase/RelA/SpoT-type nucleotidyltranferase